jgi:hypothetical protein
MSVGRYTLSRSAAAGLTGPANDRERASERARAREGEREDLLGTIYSIPAPVLCHRCRFYFRITVRFMTRLLRALFLTQSHTSLQFTA